MPEIATALLTVTVPVVLLPMALRSVASIAAELASFKVTVAVLATTKVSVVTKAAVA